MQATCLFAATNRWLSGVRYRFIIFKTLTAVLAQSHYIATNFFSLQLPLLHYERYHYYSERSMLTPHPGSCIIKFKPIFGFLPLHPEGPSWFIHPLVQLQ